MPWSIEMQRKLYEMILRNSGISEAFRKKTFDTFQDKVNSELQITSRKS